MNSTTAASLQPPSPPCAHQSQSFPPDCPPPPPANRLSLSHRGPNAITTSHASLSGQIAVQPTPTAAASITAAPIAVPAVPHFLPHLHAATAAAATTAAAAAFAARACKQEPQLDPLCSPPAVQLHCVTPDHRMEKGLSCSVSIMFNDRRHMSRVDKAVCRGRTEKRPPQPVPTYVHVQ